MASIITNISFKNFYNYYGGFEENEYIFSEGVNIVVADNGNGKSKFFNSFLWLFNDEVLDSDTKSRPSIRTAALKILSDKAKNEVEKGKEARCGIRVRYKDSQYEYEITKGFTAKRIGESIASPDDWYIYIEEIEVSKRDLILLQYHPVREEDERNRILNKLIQTKLRPYSLFQGEEVDKLIDFSNPKAIKDAVETLTNIQTYVKLKNTTSYMFKRAEDSLNNKTTTSNQDTKRFDAIIQEIEGLRRDLEIEEERNVQYASNFTEYREKIESLETTNENAEKRKEFDDKIKTATSQLNNLKEEYENLTSKITQRFFDTSYAWIAHGTSQYETKFRNKFQDYNEKRAAFKLQKLNTEDNSSVKFLPTDSPDYVTLKTMIDKEFCYICNRPAQKGSEEHNHLIKLLERPNKKSNVEIFKNDLSRFMSDILMGSHPYLEATNNVLNTVKETREKEYETNERIKVVVARIKDLKDKRSNLIIGNEDAESSTKSIMAEYKNVISNLENTKRQLENSNLKLQKLNKDLHLLEEEKGRLTIKDIPETYRQNYSYAMDLKNAAERTKDRIYDDMLGKLEEHANIHFKSLIKYNDLKGGELKFIKSVSDTIEFRYQDQNGNEVSGASEGFQRMKVLSVLMAIISISKTGYEYPLLADAPLSAFGQAFIKGFFEETAEVFPQSILLIKDIYDQESKNKLNALGNELLTNGKVKTIYVNQIPEGLSQIEAYTLKTKVK